MASARALLAGHAAGYSAIVASGSVHPARKLKIMCSTRYFAHVAAHIHMHAEAAQFHALDLELVALLGSIDDAVYQTHIKWLD